MASSVTSTRLIRASLLAAVLIHFLRLIDPAVTRARGLVRLQRIVVFVVVRLEVIVHQSRHHMRGTTIS